MSRKELERNNAERNALLGAIARLEADRKALMAVARAARGVANAMARSGTTPPPGLAYALNTLPAHLKEEAAK